MSELTREELDAIRERLEAAPLGVVETYNERDAEFIEHVQEDQRRLLNEVERLTAENAQWQADYKALLARQPDTEAVEMFKDAKAGLEAEVERLQSENERLRAKAVPDYSEECPTKPGGYWMCKGGHGLPILVELLHCSGEFHVCHTDGMFYPLRNQFADGWRFAGPIPEAGGGKDEQEN